MQVVGHGHTAFCSDWRRVGDQNFGVMPTAISDALASDHPCLVPR